MKTKIVSLFIWFILGVLLLGCDAGYKKEMQQYRLEMQQYEEQKKMQPRLQSIRALGLDEIKVSVYIKGLVNEKQPEMVAYAALSDLRQFQNKIESVGLFRVESIDNVTGDITQDAVIFKPKLPTRASYLIKMEMSYEAGVEYRTFVTLKIYARDNSLNWVKNFIGTSGKISFKEKVTGKEIIDAINQASADTFQRVVDSITKPPSPPEMPKKKSLGQQIVSTIGSTMGKIILAIVVIVIIVIVLAFLGVCGDCDCGDCDCDCGDCCCG